MSRTVRLSLALLFALMMVIATASAALAFDPPDNAPNGVGANTMCGFNFPAILKGPQIKPMPNAGPWNASIASPTGSPGPIPFPGTPADNDCA